MRGRAAAAAAAVWAGGAVTRTAAAMVLAGWCRCAGPAGSGAEEALREGECAGEPGGNKEARQSLTVHTNAMHSPIVECGPQATVPGRRSGGTLTSAQRLAARAN